MNTRGQRRREDERARDEQDLLGEVPAATPVSFGEADMLAPNQPEGGVARARVRDEHRFTPMRVEAERRSYLDPSPRGHPRSLWSPGRHMGGEGSVYRPPHAPTLGRFDGKSTNWEGFSRQFLTLATLSGWTERDQVLQLTGSLDGPARDFVFTTLSQEEQLDLSTLMTALERQYQPPKSEDAYLAALEQRTMGRDETVESFVAALRSLTCRAHPQIPPEVRERYAVRQFLRGVTEEACRHIGPQEPRTLAEAERMFRAWREWNPVTRRVPQPGRSAPARAVQAAPENVELRQLLALVKELLEETKKKKSPVGTPVPNGRSQGNPRFENIKCYACGELGHMRRSCPKNKSEAAASAEVPKDF